MHRPLRTKTCLKPQNTVENSGFEQNLNALRLCESNIKGTWRLLMIGTGTAHDTIVAFRLLNTPTPFAEPASKSSLRVYIQKIQAKTKQLSTELFSAFRTPTAPQKVMSTSQASIA